MHDENQMKRESERETLSLWQGNNTLWKRKINAEWIRGIKETVELLTRHAPITKLLI